MDPVNEWGNSSLETVDPEIHDLIEKEKRRAKSVKKHAAKRAKLKELVWPDFGGAAGRGSPGDWDSRMKTSV